MQMLIFLLYLVFPAAASWAFWETQLPQLFYYSGALIYICKDMGFRLARGRGLFAKGRKSEVLYDVVNWQPLGSAWELKVAGWGYSCAPERQTWPWE